MEDYINKLESIAKELEKVESFLGEDENFNYVNVLSSLQSAKNKVEDAVYGLGVAMENTEPRAEVGDMVEIVDLFNTELIVKGVRGGREYELVTTGGRGTRLTCYNYEISKNLTKGVSYE